jgi:hypothetical protein
VSVIPSLFDTEIGAIKLHNLATDSSYSVHMLHSCLMKSLYLVKSMHVCIHVSMCMCIYIYMCPRMHTSLCAYMCMYVRAHVCVCVPVNWWIISGYRFIVSGLKVWAKPEFRVQTYPKAVTSNLGFNVTLSHPTLCSRFPPNPSSVPRLRFPVPGSRFPILGSRFPPNPRFPVPGSRPTLNVGSWFPVLTKL